MEQSITDYAMAFRQGCVAAMFGFSLACAGAVAAASVAPPKGLVPFALATFDVGLTVSRNWNGFALTPEEDMGKPFERDEYKWIL
jgi:hypothetical protein